MVDADIVAFRCAASAEHDPENIAILRADLLMQDLLNTFKTDHLKSWLTGTDNYRYEIYPEYKASRKNKPQPVHLKATKEFLIRFWKTEVSEGVEADDCLGIAQDNNTIICSIDKDLLQIPGRHYNWVKQEEYNVSVLNADGNLYKQAILGDRSDDIPGYDGKARAKPPNFLVPVLEHIDECTSELEMYEFVKKQYDLENNPNLERNMHLLFIQRKDKLKWTCPIDPAISETKGT